MKFRSLLILTMFLALAPVGVVADTKADEKAIRALYASVEQAMKQKDLKAIMATGTSDFKSKELNGVVMDSKQAEQQLKMQFSMLKTMDTIQMKPEQITVKGKQATVTSTYKMVGTIASSSPEEKGKTHTIGQSGKTRDTLIKTDAGWKFKMMETLSQSGTFDGKPMNTGTAAPRASPGKKK